MNLRIFLNKYQKILFIILALGLFFSIAPEAKAAGPLIAFAVIALAPLVLGILKAFISISVFIGVVAGIHWISGFLIDSGIYLQSILLDPEKFTAIRTTWGILRDFINIFFILVLLVIAFATIFNVKDYKAKDLLPKLLIAALLINFSLIITFEVIKLLFVPAQVFLSSLTQGSSISEKLADAFNIQKFFDPGFIKYIPGIGEGAELIEWMFRGVLFVAEAFILSWIALIIWARIPVLIGLMIVSPVAWLGYTVPAIRKGSWDAWWQKLFCWGFIPIPLFGLIYFVIYFNQKLTAEINQAVPSSFLTSVLSFLGLNVSQALVWIITIGIFLGGMMYVKNLSCSMYSWVMAGLTGLWGGVRGGVGRAVDWGYTATGAAGAVKGAGGRIMEEGIPFLGKQRFGAVQREAREKRWAEGLTGLAGLPPTFAAERNTIERAEKATRDIENRLKRISGLPPGQAVIEEKRIIQEAVRKGPSDPEGLAGLMLMAKKGQLDVTTFNDAVRQFEKMPLVLTRIFSEWKEGKFGGIKADQLMPLLRDIRTPLEAKRIGYSFIASDDGKRVIEDRTFDSVEFKEMYEILGGRNTKDGRTAKKFVTEIKPTIVAEYNFNNPAREFDDPAQYPTDVEDAVLKLIKKTGSKDFTKYTKDEWNKPEFKAALRDLLSNKATTENRATGNINNTRKYAEEVRKWLIRESKDEDELRIFNDAATAAGI